MYIFIFDVNFSQVFTQHTYGWPALMGICVYYTADTKKIRSWLWS